jgi:hypothetical protein
MKLERRITPDAGLRAKKGDKPGISGHAAVFNQLSEDLGGWRERIMPGAFSDNLSKDPDVRALFNHDPNQVLGRTKSKTLRLKEDDQGLHFDNDMPDTQVARDLQTSIDRGDIDQCSFGFSVAKQKWSEEPDPSDATGRSTMVVREVHAANLFDVSPVTYPAYTGTDVDNRAVLRELFPEGIPEEVRAHVPVLEARVEAGRRKTDKKAAAARAADAACQCDCASCQRGVCGGCEDGEDCEDNGCDHGDGADGADRAAKRHEKRVAKRANPVVEIDREKMRMRLDLAARE